MRDSAKKTAFVTGGGTGIGASCARRLCHDGYHVIIGDHLIDDGDALAKALNDDGLSAELCVLDVTKEQDWLALEKSIVDHHGKLDACVLAAGVGHQQSVLDTSIDIWHKTMSVNLDGVMLGIRTAGRIMRETDHGGSIVAISSIMASRGSVGYSAYSASKGAIVSYVRCAALELAQLNLGICVNSVSPGNVDTPMLRTTMAKILPDWETADAALAANIPLGYVAAPEHIADAVSAILDPRFSYVTGTDIIVDGGLIAGV